MNRNVLLESSVRLHRRITRAGNYPSLIRSNSVEA